MTNYKEAGGDIYAANEGLRKIKSHVYDENKQALYDTIDNGLYSRQSGTAVVEMNSVYFLNKKFGISWKLNSLVVYEPQRLKGFQFIGV